jgi:peptidoglycan/LPS O-acetylase OafA/YrhL
MINQLTGIRAILAWSVVFLHILCDPKVSGYFWFAPLFSRGNLAVHGFFVLSGFILCHVYSVALSSFSLQRYGSFLVARIARIYPVHVVVLVAFLLVVIANRSLHLPNAGASFSVLDLGLSLLLVQAWGFSNYPAWNVVSWSISAEWFAYLLFPVFLIVVVKSYSLLRVVVATVVSIVALYWVSFTQKDIPGPPGFYRTLLVLVCANFALGCAAYVVTRAYGKTQAWVGTAAASAAILCASCHVDAFFSFFFAVLVVALSSERDWLSGLLSGRVMVYLGETSYSVYLVHVLLWGSIARIARMAGVMNSSSALYVVAVVLVVIAAASSLLYHMVEVPARRQIREFSRRRLGARGSEQTAIVSTGCEAHPLGAHCLVPGAFREVAQRLRLRARFNRLPEKEN